MGPADQTLMNTHGVTVLSFEKLLDDERHPIVLGDNNTFIFAQSSNGNDLGYHGKSSRGSFTLFLDELDDPPAPNGPSTKAGKHAKSSTTKAGKNKI
ncbi:hypothetical protein ACHAXN_004349 [Cyclotella atomus]